MPALQPHYSSPADAPVAGGTSSHPSLRPVQCFLSQMSASFASLPILSLPLITSQAPQSSPTISDTPRLRSLQIAESVPGIHWQSYSEGKPWGFPPEQQLSPALNQVLCFNICAHDSPTDLCRNWNYLSAGSIRVRDHVWEVCSHSLPVTEQVQLSNCFSGWKSLKYDCLLP